MSRSFRPLGGAFAAGLVAVALLASSAGGAPVAPCHGPTSQPPNVGSRFNTLDGVAVTSACDVWAVGYYSLIRGAPRPLIEHWNGRAWKVQASPVPRAGFSELWGVAATSAKNAWAVGYYGGGTKFQRTLIEHWNGKSWKVQPSLSPRSVSVLSGVVATSAKTAWAVGGDGTMHGPGEKTLVEHWNGKTWKIQRSPDRPGVGTFGANGLSGVAATSANNAWAVGSHWADEKTLIERWNGKRWKIQASTKPETAGRLSGVAATSATNAWAVGDLNNGRTLIERWNGKTWKFQRGPKPGTAGSLSGVAVAATSATNAWAVGCSTDCDKTLVEHWNGKAWRIQRSPSPGSPGPYGGPGNELLGVAATSAKNAWAVGDYYNGRTYRTLALHWNGTSWSR